MTKEERREKRKNKEKIKFKDRPFVKYIKEHAPDLLGNTLDFVGEVTGISIVEKLGEKIAGTEAGDHLTADETAIALELLKAELDHDALIQQEVTKRWNADMISDNKLSKLARPIVLLYSWFLMTVIIVLDFCGLEISGIIINMASAMCITVTGGYFGLRTVEKRNYKKYLKDFNSQSDD